MDTAHGEHADHIHPNCKCHFMVRFSKEYDVEGYEPGKYKKICNWAKKNAKKEKDWVHVMGVRTFFWTNYAINPSCLRYWIGLIPPSDTFIRSSAYQCI